MAKLSSVIAASHSGGRLHQQHEQKKSDSGQQQVRSERVQVQVHEQQRRQAGGINMSTTRAATLAQQHHTRSSSLALTPKGRLGHMQTNTREDHKQQEQQPRQPKPRTIAIKSARRELFAAPPQDCGGEGKTENKHEKPPREGLASSKWWRPCWNDGQLDGELLFEQVKARHEHRLLMASEGPREISSSDHHHRGSHSELAGSQASCVYAVPRSSLLKTIQHPDRREPSADEEEEEEEDPLSDPLYASVLGTSKQAQPYQKRQVESTTTANLNSQLGIHALGHHEMSSLVKSCLEVERATRSLLLVETRPVQEGDELTLEKNKEQESSRTAAASAASNLRATSDRDFERNQEAADSWPRSGQPKV